MHRLLMIILNILDLLRKHAAETLLRQLRANKLKHKSQSEFQVWQEGSKPKQIQGEEMMRQKLEYIHMNPVKRGYVDDPVHWRYSSASNYARKEGVMEVDIDWR